VLWLLLRYAAIPLCLTALTALVYAANTVARAPFTHRGLRNRALTIGLHLMQPAARLWGRATHGLTLRRAPGLHLRIPCRGLFRLWSDRWQASEEWLHMLEIALGEQDEIVRRGGDFDRWDLEVRGGLFGGVRARLGVEEHGSGKQLLLLRTWPVCSRASLTVGILLASLACAAALDHAPIAAALFASVAVALAVCSVLFCARAQSSIARAIRSLDGKIF